MYVKASPVTVRRPGEEPVVIAAYSPAELNVVKSGKRQAKTRAIVARKQERAGQAK